MTKQTRRNRRHALNFFVAGARGKLKFLKRNTKIRAAQEPGVANRHKKNAIRFSLTSSNATFQVGHINRLRESSYAPNPKLNRVKLRSSWFLDSFALVRH